MFNSASLPQLLPSFTSCTPENSVLPTTMLHAFFLHHILYIFLPQSPGPHLFRHLDGTQFNIFLGQHLSGICSIITPYCTRRFIFIGSKCFVNMKLPPDILIFNAMEPEHPTRPSLKSGYIAWSHWKFLWFVNQVSEPTPKLRISCPITIFHASLKFQSLKHH